MSRTARSERPPLDPQMRRNRNVAIVCAVTFFGMVGAAFAAVPIYRAFCQVTGYGGAVRRAEAAPDKLSDQKLTVGFDTNVRGLPWDFSAEQRAQTLRIGETKLAFFKVTNHADHPITARAVFNVSPDQAGTYFRKLQCFCFSDQTVGAGQTVEMPVLYFVDPKFADDINTKGVTDVTLSYTFYPAVDAKPAPVTAR
ncbi:MAG: coxG [Phenylobacterium sp.]|nr:coxG [Phenylobacterium sp.]MDB5442067.1 coxG [Phenylobacterium sp.]MDB5495275.1 coxG [Phenylobacterium sp.]